MPLFASRCASGGSAVCGCCPPLEGTSFTATISGGSNCDPGDISYTGFSGSYTIDAIGGGFWYGIVGTVTDTIQTVDAILEIFCVGGLYYVAIGGFGDFQKFYSSFTTIPLAPNEGYPLDTPMPDVGSALDCTGSGGNRYLYGFTVTISLN